MHNTANIRFLAHYAKYLSTKNEAPAIGGLILCSQFNRFFVS
jgi:hypothetical protein